MSCVCSMAFQCGSTLAKVQLLQAANMTSSDKHSVVQGNDLILDITDTDFSLDLC